MADDNKGRRPSLRLTKPGYISDAIGVALLAVILLAQRLPVRTAAK
jgi:hypothetical protein